MIRFEKVSKWFGQLQVLNEITLEIPKGQVVVVCGPSGSGKSTMIRTINGLEQIQDGKIIVDEVDIHAKTTNLNLVRQRLGFVFQQFNLFPHMSVLDNVTFAPVKIQKRSVAESREFAMELLSRVGLADKAHTYPGFLSGGQQQRVAITRALALRPPVMLFDEPTSALDPEMVGEVLQVMKSLANEGMTMVCVTHEMGFARDVGDRILFLESGNVVVDATPDAFFNNPEHPRVRRFLSEVHRD